MDKLISFISNGSNLIWLESHTVSFIKPYKAFIFMFVSVGVNLMRQGVANALLTNIYIYIFFNLRIIPGYRIEEMQVKNNLV
jgi:hypothetical protein